MFLFLWHEVMRSVCLVVTDAVEYVCAPCSWGDAIQIGSFDQRVRSFGDDEELVLETEGDAADGAFSGIVVELGA